MLADLALPSPENLTATAILGWYAWYTASKTIPSLMADFRAEMATNREACRADRDAFRQELAEQRAQQHADNLTILEALRELTAPNMQHTA